MDYRFKYWGPLLLDTKINDEFQNFLNTAVEETLKERNEFLHGIVKLKEEHSFSDKNKKEFYKHFLPHLETYDGVYNNVWYNDRDSEATNGYILQNVWVNWQGPNEFRSFHCHDGDLSFVIYQDIPKEMLEEANKEPNPGIKPGAIIFQNELKDIKASKYPSLVSRDVIPQTGQCFIFPNDLHHYTIPFKSDCYRVSISGNVYLKED